MNWRETCRQFFVEILERLLNEGEKFGDIHSTEILLEMFDDDGNLSVDGSVRLEHDELKDINKEGLLQIKAIEYVGCFERTLLLL